MKTNFQILSVMFIFVGLFGLTAVGQGLSPFQGQGLKDNQGSAPNWFGSSGTTEKTEAAPSWFGHGILRSAKPGEVNERPALFGGLFQRGESTEPSLMHKASDRSREMWERTRGWAAEKNDALKNRTGQAWETLTSGLRPAGSQAGEQAAPAPFNGSIRTAENPNSARSEKF